MSNKILNNNIIKNNQTKQNNKFINIIMNIKNNFNKKNVIIIKYKK